MKIMLENAKAAKTEIARLTTEQKNAALNAMADALVANEADILAANGLDLEAAKGTVSDVMLDRLLLTSARIAGMAEGIRQVAALPDPVGRILEEYTRSDGLLIQKTAVPMGVIAIIYEHLRRRRTLFRRGRRWRRRLGHVIHRRAARRFRRRRFQRRGRRRFSI